MKNNHRTTHLHIYMGKQGIKGIAKGENGKIVNDNHPVKLTYGSLEWTHFMKNLKSSGIIKVDVVGFLKKDWKKGPFTYDPAKGIQEEVDKYMGVQVEVTQTPDQKRIAELEARIEKMEGKKEISGGDNDTPGDGTPDVDEELEDARVRFKEVFGNDPHHMKQLKGINEDIEEELQRQNDAKTEGAGSETKTEA